MSRNLFASLLAVTNLALLTLIAGAADSGGVKITELPGKLRVEINGELFTEHIFQGAPHVYFYPLLGPGGLPMTRNYPMVPDSEGEAHDHPHHRSLWFSHGAVNGVGRGTWQLGGLVRAPQVGRIRNYILFTATCVAAVVLWMVLA